MERKFKRDKRSPIPTSKAVSIVMSANKAKNTNPEIILRKELWKQNIRGYRLPLPKSNRNFWKEKFNKNVERDKLKIKMLIKEKWNCLVIWECEINKELQYCIKKIKKELN